MADSNSNPNSNFLLFIDLNSGTPVVLNRDSARIDSVEALTKQDVGVVGSWIHATVSGKHVAYKVKQTPIEVAKMLNLSGVELGGSSISSFGSVDSEDLSNSSDDAANARSTS